MMRGLDRYSVHALPQLDMFGSSTSSPVPPRVAIEVRVILERIYAILSTVGLYDCYWNYDLTLYPKCGTMRRMLIRSDTASDN